MKEKYEATTELGILGANVNIRVEEKNDVYSLKLGFSQNVDCALDNQVSIYCPTKKEVLDLAKNLRDAAKFLPDE